MVRGDVLRSGPGYEIHLVLWEGHSAVCAVAVDDSVGAVHATVFVDSGDATAYT